MMQSFLEMPPVRRTIDSLFRSSRRVPQIGLPRTNFSHYSKNVHPTSRLNRRVLSRNCDDCLCRRTFPGATAASRAKSSCAPFDARGDEVGLPRQARSGKAGGGGCKEGEERTQCFGCCTVGWLAESIIRFPAYFLWNALRSGISKYVFLCNVLDSSRALGHSLIDGACARGVSPVGHRVSLWQYTFACA